MNVCLVEGLTQVEIEEKLEITFLPNKFKLRETRSQMVGQFKLQTLSIGLSRESHWIDLVWTVQKMWRIIPGLKIFLGTIYFTRDWLLPLFLQSRITLMQIIRIASGKIKTVSKFNKICCYLTKRMWLLYLLGTIMTMKTPISIKKCSRRSKWLCNQSNNRVKTSKLQTLKIEMIAIASTQ